METIKKNIQERIKQHEIDAKNASDFIKQNPDSITILEGMLGQIKDARIRISELNLVLEKCFKE